MSKFVEVTVTVHKLILVEVKDGGDESLALAQELAEEEVWDNTVESGITDVMDEMPNSLSHYDEILRIEDYE